MRLVVKTYKYKLYNSKKNRYLVRQIELASEIWNFCIAMQYKKRGEGDLWLLGAKRARRHLY